MMSGSDMALVKAIAKKQATSSCYHPAGSKTCDELLPALLVPENVGATYTITDEGETNEYFIDGTGLPITINDNVVVSNVGTVENPVIKFDLKQGFVDLSGYVEKEEGKGLSENDFTDNDKDNLDANTSARHTHSNKNVLDNTTASYTTEEATKLSGIQNGATKVEASDTNGNVKINGTESTVYTHPGSGTNPHGTTKGDVGLGNVDNTSDLNKPISNAVNAKLIEAAESMKTLWDLSAYADKTVNCSIGEPWDSYVAGQEYFGQNFLDVENGKIYDVVQSIPSGEYGFVESGQVNHISTSYNKTPVFGIHINDAESNPDRKVTYIADAVGMTPAHMNFTSGTFDYGSWEDVWFVRDTKPCLLKDNGQIHRYLNKNNFLKDIDGNDTGVPQITIHTMIEFPKIWYKVVPDIDGKGASIYISPVKVDADYVDYPYIDYQGIHKEHFYMPAYNGSTQTESGTTYLCSTYGETVSKNLTAEQEIAYCKAHGNGWNTEDAGSIMLINFLLILMGKSTDVQSVFGQGLHTSGTEAINNGFTTGIHYNKGMFYGTNSGTIASNNYSNTVKVFGIENYWGFQWRRYAGDILVDGTRKIKLCYGNEDGSSTFDYNLTGEGYIDIGATHSGTSGGYISEMKFTKTGMYGKVSSGSSTTHYCDGQWYNNSGTRYALRGGGSTHGAPVGAFCVDLSPAASDAWWSIGAAPSYK